MENELEKEVLKEYSVEGNVSNDGLEASIRVVPAVEEVASIDESVLMQELSNFGIKFGIMPDAVHRIAEEKILNIWIPVARGVPAGNPVDGYVKFNFEKEKNKVKLHEDASGKVNFREMNLIQNVKKGDVLCELIPPEAGKSGTSVKGEEIHGQIGVLAKLPSGKNVETSENKLLAAIDGMVVWNESEITIEPVYIVDKVDSSIGNIRFNGSVVVNGEVGDGFEIHAAEDVTIAMSVGRVIIESGGNIKINGGVLGQDMARLTAEGSIRIKFVQDSHLTAKKEIIVEDYIRSSNVTAGGPIIIKSQNGWISGGMISSEAWIYCHTIGLDNTPVDTKLAIGHNPLLYVAREQCEEEIVEKIGDFLKLQASIQKLRIIKTQNQLTSPQEKLYEKILSAVETIKLKLHEKDSQCTAITEKINSVFAGNIYVEGVAHEGTRIKIGIASRDLHSPRNQVQFSLKDGEIGESEFVMLPDIKKFLESE